MIPKCKDQNKIFALILPTIPVCIVMTAINIVKLKFQPKNKKKIIKNSFYHSSLRSIFILNSPDKI